MGRRSDIDWEKIEKDYRLGSISIADVAKKHGVALSGLKGKAKAKGWTRDLTAVVQAATKAGITEERANYAKELAEKAPEIGREIGRRVSEAANSGLDTSVAAAAALGIMRNRLHADIADEILGAGKDLLDEVRALRGTPESVESLLLAVSQENANMARSLAKALSMQERARTLDTISAAVGKAVGVDRKANNLDDGAPPKEPEISEEQIESRLARLLEKARS